MPTRPKNKNKSLISKKIKQDEEAKSIEQDQNSEHSPDSSAPRQHGHFQQRAFPYGTH